MIISIAGVLYYVSSTVNPILYNLMSRKFRQAFHETLCFCCRRRHRLRSQVNSSHRVTERPVSDASFTNISVLETADGAITSRLRRRRQSSWWQTGARRSTPLLNREAGSSVSSRYRYLFVPSRWSRARPGDRAPTGRDYPGRKWLKPAELRPTRNGNDLGGSEDSDSVSSLPSTLAAYIREELELSPQHQHQPQHQQQQPLLQKQSLQQRQDLSDCCREAGRCTENSDAVASAESANGTHLLFREELTPFDIQAETVM